MSPQVSLGPPSFEAITAALLQRIPAEQWTHVLDSHDFAEADIGPEFLGFVHIYWHLAALIPRHWTIVDLGCAYAPQAFAL